jgi:hypothetical protein
VRRMSEHPPELRLRDDEVDRPEESHRLHSRWFTAYAMYATGATAYRRRYRGRSPSPEPSPPAATTTAIRSASPRTSAAHRSTAARRLPADSECREAVGRPSAKPSLDGQVNGTHLGRSEPPRMARANTPGDAEDPSFSGGRHARHGPGYIERGPEATGVKLTVTHLIARSPPGIRPSPETASSPGTHRSARRWTSSPRGHRGRARPVGVQNRPCRREVGDRDAKRGGERVEFGGRAATSKWSARSRARPSRCRSWGR